MNTATLRTLAKLQFVASVLVLGLRAEPTFAAATVKSSASASASPKGGSAEATAPAGSDDTAKEAAGSAGHPVQARGEDTSKVQAADSPRATGTTAGEAQAESKAAEPAAAAASAAQPSPPVARKTVFRFGVGLDLTEVWQRSRGFDVFSTNDIATHVGLLVELDILRFGRRLFGSVELGWDTDSQNEPALFRDFKAEFLSHNFHVGAKLRYQLAPFLAPHIRLGLGESWMRTQFETANSSGGRNFETVEWGTFARIGAGVTAPIPANSDVLPGVVLEGGYLVAESMPLQLDPDLPKQAIASSGAHLGSYGRSGPYIRLGAFVRY